MGASIAGTSAVKFRGVFSMFLVICRPHHTLAASMLRAVTAEGKLITLPLIVKLNPKELLKAWISPRLTITQVDCHQGWLSRLTTVHLPGFIYNTIYQPSGKNSDCLNSSLGINWWNFSFSGLFGALENLERFSSIFLQQFPCCCLLLCLYSETSPGPLSWINPHPACRRTPTMRQFSRHYYLTQPNTLPVQFPWLPSTLWFSKVGGFFQVIWVSTESPGELTVQKRKGGSGKSAVKWIEASAASSQIYFIFGSQICFVCMHELRVTKAFLNH